PRPSRTRSPPRAGFVLSGVPGTFAPVRVQSARRQQGGCGMGMGRPVVLLFVAAVLAMGPSDARAQEGAEGIVDLEALVVSGAQPGPGMWKVRKGEHVMHILGTVSPLPRRMEWASDEVEAVIARSQ